MFPFFFVDTSQSMSQNGQSSQDRMPMPVQAAFRYLGHIQKVTDPPPLRTQTEMQITEEPRAGRSLEDRERAARDQALRLLTQYFAGEQLWGSHEEESEVGRWLPEPVQVGPSLIMEPRTGNIMLVVVGINESGGENGKHNFVFGRDPQSMSSKASDHASSWWLHLPPFPEHQHPPIGEREELN